MELLDGVWGHRHLSDAALTTRIKEIRRAVDDDGTRQQTIKNVRGRGYRFVAALVPVPSSPWNRPEGDELIGRDEDLATVVEALQRVGVVMVTGPGGVGKSTLARAAIDALSASAQIEAHWIELAAVEADAPILPVVARTLDVELDLHHPEPTLHSIARREALLVFDNCEHVADAVGAVIEALMTVRPSAVRILATSRVALGLAGEQVVSVKPLSVDQAAKLFVRRSRAAGGVWDPDEVSPVAVADLVAGLDRLPLTIEMAAARARSMSFAELASTVAARTPMLQVSHRSPVRRHQSLDSLVRSSAELLDHRLRAVLEDFSVFAGAVSAGDAARVLVTDDFGESDGVIVDLATLVESSLLVADVSGSATRYSMLVTVRTVASRWLAESGRETDVRRRHAEALLAILTTIDDALRTTDEPEARARFNGLVDEIRVAHRWARTHAPELASAMSVALFQCAHPILWHEPAEWSRTLLREQSVDSHTALPGAVLLAAGLAAHTGQLEFARVHAGALRAASDGRLRAIATEIVADVALYEGDLELALEAAAELRQLGRELGDPHALAFGCVDAALAYAFAGDATAALAELADVDADEFGPTDRAWLAQARGDALSVATSPAAVDAFSEALELGTAVGNHFVVSVALTSLAAEYGRAGDTARALETYLRALTNYQRHGNTTHAVTALRNLIALLFDLGDSRGVAVLAGALSDDRLRRSYGAEADRIGQVVAETAAAIGPVQFDRWFGEGQVLDVEQAIRAAQGFVEHHRG